MRIGIGIRIGNSITGSVLDPATSAFITATGITNPTQIAAINTLVVDLKNSGLWTKLKAIYPIVGGSATSHMYNLKDPRNLDAAFRLAFSGGWTHSSNGALPNGVNGFANTFLVPNAQFANMFISMGVYSRTNNTTNGCDIGVTNNAVSAGIEMFSYFSGNTLNGCGDFGNRANYVAATSTRLRGFTRESATSLKSYLQGVQQSVNTTNDTTLLSGFTNPIYLGGRNLSNAINSPSNKELAFGYVGEPLTNAENLILSNSVTAFQTTLGRNV